MCVCSLPSFIVFLAQKIHSKEDCSWQGQLWSYADLGVTVSVNKVKNLKYICIFQEKHKKIKANAS